MNIQMADFFYSRQKIWSILKSCAAEITAWISSRAMVQCSLLGREHIKRLEPMGIQ